MRKIFRRACQPVDPWALTTMLHYSSISGRSSPGETLLLRWPDHFLRQKQKGPTSSQTHSMGRQEEEERRKLQMRKPAAAVQSLMRIVFFGGHPRLRNKACFVALISCFVQDAACFIAVWWWRLITSKWHQVLSEGFDNDGAQYDPGTEMLSVSNIQDKPLDPGYISKAALILSPW